MDKALEFLLNGALNNPVLYKVLREQARKNIRKTAVENGVKWDEEISYLESKQVHVLLFIVYYLLHS